MARMNSTELGRRAWAPALLLGAALALGAVTGTSARPAREAAAGPAQPTPSPETVTGISAGRRLRLHANWRVQRCGDSALVPVRSDMDIGAFRGTLVRIQGLPTACPSTGRDVLWLTSVEPVADCSPPTPTPAPSPTAQPGPNLALNRPVLASADDPAGPPGWAVDGNPATTWLAGGDVAWIYVDLGQDRTFNRMHLRWGTPHAVRYGIFVLEYDNWEFKYEVDGGDGGDDDFVIPRLYGRWVLLYAVASSSPTGGYALEEWEIYGQETANLAIGQPVAVSDYQTCCPGYLANDANYETGWASEITAAAGAGGTNAGTRQPQSMAPTPVAGRQSGGGVAHVLGQHRLPLAISGRVLRRRHHPHPPGSLPARRAASPQLAVAGASGRHLALRGHVAVRGQCGLGRGGGIRPRQRPVRAPAGAAACHRARRHVDLARRRPGDAAAAWPAPAHRAASRRALLPGRRGGDWCDRRCYGS